MYNDNAKEKPLDNENLQHLPHEKSFPPLHDPAPPIFLRLKTRENLAVLSEGAALVDVELVFTVAVEEIRVEWITVPADLVAEADVGAFEI